MFMAVYEMLLRFDGESTFEYQPMLANPGKPMRI